MNHEKIDDDSPSRPDFEAWKEDLETRAAEISQTEELPPAPEALDRKKVYERALPLYRKLSVIVPEAHKWLEGLLSGSPEATPPNLIAAAKANFEALWQIFEELEKITFGDYAEPEGALTRLDEIERELKDKFNI